MSERKEEFSPGPWSGDFWAVEDVNGTSVCSMVDRLEDTFPNYLANRSLIAAAPELYSALNSLRNEIVGITGMPGIGATLCDVVGVTNLQCLLRRIDEAAEVLKKARGE